MQFQATSHEGDNGEMSWGDTKCDGTVPPHGLFKCLLVYAFPTRPNSVTLMVGAGFVGKRSVFRADHAGGSLIALALRLDTSTAYAIAILCVLLFGPAAAATLSGRAEMVDGDTIKVGNIPVHSTVLMRQRIGRLASVTAIHTLAANKQLRPLQTSSQDSQFNVRLREGTPMVALSASAWRLNRTQPVDGAGRLGLGFGQILRPLCCRWG